MRGRELRLDDFGRLGIDGLIRRDNPKKKCSNDVHLLMRWFDSNLRDDRNSALIWLDS